MQTSNVIRSGARGMILIEASRDKQLTRTEVIDLVRAEHSSQPERFASLCLDFLLKKN